MSANTEHIGSLVQMRAGPGGGERLSDEILPAEQMWAEKRVKQSKDMANVRSGKVSGMAMGWFDAKRIKQVEILDSPY